MRLTCPQCSKHWKISRPSSAPMARTVKCPACGGQIPTAQKTSKQEAASSGIIEVTCQNCAKIYRLPSSKIPPGATRARCKACGESIALAPFLKTEATRSEKAPPPHTKKQPVPAPSQEKAPEQTAPPKAKPPKKRRGLRLALVAAAVVLVAAILALAYWYGPRYFHAAKAPALPSAGSPGALEPVVALKINVPALIEILDRQVANSEKAQELKDKVGQLKKLGLASFEAAIFPDVQFGGLAAVALRGGNGFAAERLVTGDGLLAPYVEKIDQERYRFNRASLPEGSWGKVPVERYRLYLAGNDCIIAPQSLLDGLPAGQDLIARSSALKFAQSVDNQGNVAVLAIRLPQNVSMGWQEKLTRNPAVESFPQAKMVAGLAAMLLQQFTEPFKQLDFIAAGLRMDADGQRQLRYAQQFRSGVDGAAIFAKLQKRQADSGPGVVNGMIRLLYDPRLQNTMDFSRNQLHLEIGWHQKDDEPILKALSQATIGQLFAGAMMQGGQPTPGPVKTVYRETPQLVSRIDPQRLKIRLPQQIGKALFPDHFWQTGEDPNMTLEMDPVMVENAELAEVDYDVLRITSPDGRNIRRKADQPFKAHVDLSGRYAGRIQLDVLKGTRPEDLGTARLQFKVSVPIELARFEFTAGSAQRTQKSGPIQTVVERMEKDIAQVNISGGKGLWIFAFDRTGRAISRRESMGSEDGKFVRFSGIIDKLLVVVASQTLSRTFNVDVDLNQGRKIELTHKPQVPPRIRLDLSPVLKYQAYTAKELADMRVTWFDGAAQAWSQPGLIIKLPRGPFSGRADWEAHFFGQKSALQVDGTSFTSDTQIGYWVDKKKLEAVHAVFGKVHVKAPAEIESLRFDLRDGNTTIRQPAGHDQEIELTFHQNEIAYRPGAAKVIQIRAYDVRDRRLKMDSYSSSDKGTFKRYFWGLPERIEMEVVTRYQEHTLGFDLRPRAIDKKAFEAYQQEIDQRRKVARALHQIYEARRKDFKQYGEDLAGFYFLSGHTDTLPIDKAAALSDPNGQIRFGYRTRPYQGYHFMVLPKSERFITKMEQMREHKGQSYTYKGQTIKALPSRHLLDLAAVPEDKSKPTLFINWGRIYMKHLNGRPLTSVPDNYYGGDWKEVKFVE